MTIRLRLALMVVALLLPTLAACWWFIDSAYDNEERSLQASVRDTTRALSMVVERELSKRMLIASLLAESPWLDKSPDPTPAELQRFVEQARRAMQGTDGWVVLSSRSNQLANTLNPDGTPPPPPRDGPSTSARFPFAVDKPTLSGLAVGRISQRLVASVQAPVRRDGVTSLNVGVTLLPSELQRIVDEQKIPDGWTAAVLDAQGLIAARKPAPERWVGKPATADLIRNSQAALEGFFDARTLDGVASFSSFSKSPVYGWTFAIGVPKLQYGSVVRRSLGSLLAVAAALLLLSVATALSVGRRISRPFALLRRQAELLESGGVFTAAATGGPECDEVSRALASASVKISTAREGLQEQVRVAVEEARRSADQLAQGHRLESLGRLTGGVAHDFNNLLAVIGSNAEVMRLRHGDSEPARQLAAIGRAVEAGSKLTQHLLRFSRQQAVRPERIRLDEYLASTCELLRTMFGSPVTVDWATDADVHDVEVDPAEFELALMNLGLNARDAMPKGGRLSIHAGNVDGGVDGDAGRSLSERLADMPHVLISFADTGSGIAPEALERVFEPFFTTKSVGKGTGLGLSLVFGFCKQAGGTASVLRTSPAGTVIGLYLPAVTAARYESAPGFVATSVVEAAPLLAGPPSQAPEQPTDDPAEHPTGRTIMLVEDNIELGDTTEEWLSAAGYRVQRAPGADQALHALLTRRDRPDVVLTDVVMPGSMDGLELAQRLRELSPPMPVVVVTGYAEKIPDQRGFTVLRKPCLGSELLQALERAVEGR